MENRPKLLLCIFGKMFAYTEKKQNERRRKNPLILFEKETSMGRQEGRKISERISF